ncbi:hypothetical protein ACFWQG_09115 [Rhodococcus sp. NPDC058532]|uniref:hypothetical protein n=1 Tax=Rhodococcus sp. NPDC058532 TaxID=3346540 RepID=UPI00364827A3
MADNNEDRRSYGSDDRDRRRGGGSQGGNARGGHAQDGHRRDRNTGESRDGGGHRGQERRSEGGFRGGDRRPDRRAGDDRRSGGDRSTGRGDTRGERRSDGGYRAAGGDNRSDRRSGGDRRGGGPQRRGGEGAFAPRPRDGGVYPERRAARPDEPELPEDIQAGELDPAVRRDLLSLDKSNANTVARHLVMASKLLEDDPQQALAHVRAARQRAGRVAVVRETAGIVAYHAGEWAEALSELRAARRMAGGPGLLAVMADCERGLGRPERAIELGRSEEARALTGDEATELRIVVAGARMDLGQADQAVVTLQTPELDASKTGPTAARLFYAYADALVAAGRVEDGLKWFLNSAAADLDGDTDAEERVADLSGDQ